MGGYGPWRVKDRMKERMARGRKIESSGSTAIQIQTFLFMADGSKVQFQRLINLIISLPLRSRHDTPTLRVMTSGAIHIAGVEPLARHRRSIRLVSGTHEVNHFEPSEPTPASQYVHRIKEAPAQTHTCTPTFSAPRHSSHQPPPPFRH